MGWVRGPGLTGRSVLLSILAVLALAAAACSNETAAEGLVVRTPTPTPVTIIERTSHPTASPTPRPQETPTPTETAEAGASDVVTNITDLLERFGYPAGTNYARIRIPSIGVDAKVGSRLVGGDGMMPEPGGPADVIWYDLAGWDGMGGAPGGGGNAIFSGHVDYSATVGYAGVRYRGQGIFSELRLLSQGDIVEIDYNGETLRYEVSWRRQLHAVHTDWAEIWSSNTGGDVITLYTCGGDFNAATQEYADRVVVRAVRV